ncbi:MAG: RHS repeat-associated core domain-containing protein [Bacteroidota bacterium]
MQWDTPKFDSNGNSLQESGVQTSYTYNGKEFQDDLGINWHYYGFRMYDPAIARFTSVDPIADQFPNLSGFNYADNNPIRNIDLHGLQGLSVVDRQLDWNNTNYLKGNKTKEEFHETNTSIGAGGLFGASLLLPGPEDLLPIGAALSFLGKTLGLTKKAAKTIDKVEDTTEGGSFVFRADDRSPNEIFEKGFESKGDNMDLEAHVLSNPNDSGFISTSKSPNVAREDFAGSGDHVFTIKKPANGIDVNKALGGKNPFRDEKKIAVPNSIAPNQILGARKVGADGKFTGTFLKNTNN